MQPYHEAKYGAPHQTPCLIGSASKEIFCASYLTLKMTSDQKTFNMKVVRIVETVKITFGHVSIRSRLPPQKRPARCSQFKPNSFGKFGQDQSEFTRVLDVNPSLFLAREVQPPLIYLRGDGRLNNNTQSINQSTTFYLLSFLLNPSSSSSSFFVRSSSLQGGEPRGPRGVQFNLGQPIAAAHPDGVPPGRVGFRVPKALACCLVYRAGSRPPAV